MSLCFQLDLAPRPLSPFPLWPCWSQPSVCAVSSQLCGCRAAQPLTDTLCWLQHSLMLCLAQEALPVFLWLEGKDPGVVCTGVKGLQLPALLSSH